MFVPIESYYLLDPLFVGFLRALQFPPTAHRLAYWFIYFYLNFI